MKRIAFTTLGCKANWSDTEALIQTLSFAGFQIVSFDTLADIYVVNTCTVTALADSQSRQMLRRAKRRSPDAHVVATGCYGEMSKDELASLKEVDRVFGTKDRKALVEYLFDLSGSSFPRGHPEGACSRRIPEVQRDAIVDAPLDPQSRARAFIKIQEGCDKSCTYCIIQMARGKSKSLPLEEVTQLCLKLTQHHREIVLAGIDIGQYGKDLEDGTSLVTLLKKLTSEQGLARLRLSSLAPNDISCEIIELLATGNFCPHVHLSIQSCSDNVLQHMGRCYSATDVKRAAGLLVQNIPGIAITGDVIAGFPGESEDDHKQTLDTLTALPLAGLHVFPFSARSRTLAAKMDGQVPHDIKRRRAFEVRKVALSLRRRYLESLIGNSMDVIVTSKRPRDDGSVEGVAENGVHISLPKGVVPYGKMGKAIITDITEQNVRGIWESVQTKRQGSNSSKRHSDIALSARNTSSAL
ncbi:MAG: tRNA (N(6)-L-threonylcarbamoyladenosine(37)-C(2))-methylthiotransferase MtaB [Pseudomonadota bacterium]